MVTLDDIKKLRDKTGVGITDCKDALTEAKGNIEKAQEILRKKGLAKSQRRGDKVQNQGTIGSYIHNNQIGVIVELNSETDFVARNEKFIALAKDIAMHIAAANPIYITPENIPQEVKEKEESIYKAELKLDNKPKDVAQKILDGKLAKYYEEVCLMEQPFIKDSSKKIKDIINEVIAALGEKITVGRFSRIAIGEI